MSAWQQTHATFTALVCRGCCCARDGLEPCADEQLAVVRTAAASVPGARVRVTDCLGPCSSKNVIAVRHRRRDTPGVRHGTTWFGELADGAPLDALDAWLRRGAAAGAVPAALERHRLVDPQVLPDEMLRVLPRSVQRHDATSGGGR